MSLFPQHANPELDAQLEADVKFFMKHGAYLLQPAGEQLE
jgi:4-diphosphocytidyl-2C-methyl-D-erythritol kinase|eukprot:COSAG06_NODE_1092_length_10744_cov_67.135181_12_plen_40_part_00